MRQFLSSLFSSAVSGVGGVLQGLALTRILAWACVLLLAATLVLGSLLRSSYEKIGALETTQVVLVKQVESLKEQKKDLKDSCELTNKLIGDNTKADKVSDDATRRMIKQIGEAINEKPEDDSADRIPPALWRLLDSATCQARNNGIPCNTAEPTDPL